MRDAKAAVRWIRANSAELGVDAAYITAIGGSAGACSVVGLATTLEVSGVLGDVIANVSFHHILTITI